MSAFRLEADTPPYPNDVGFGPIADMVNDAMKRAAIGLVGLRARVLAMHAGSQLPDEVHRPTAPAPTRRSNDG